MSIALSVLVARVAEDVPARNTVPSEDQYERCVTAAVGDYSRRRPLQRLATLSVVSGTATYDLPGDFLSVIRMESLASGSDGVLFSAEGLIPVSDSYEERYYVLNGQITFDPTPTYTMARDLWYTAGHTLNESETYPNMSESDAEVLLQKAAALALGLQANAAAQEAWQYQIGDERVSKEKLAAALDEAAARREQGYERALKNQVGIVGMRARYDSLGR